METKDIKEFIKMLNDSEFRYAKIDDNGTVLELSKDKLTFATSNEPTKNVETIVETKEAEHRITSVLSDEEEINTKVLDDESQFVIKSPLVGTFYESPSPDLDAYVKVGDKVKAGDTLCIIEAMKLMNEIEAEVSGEVVEILVTNEGPVEYGQPLFKIATA